MTKVSLPVSLAAATQEAEALELRITRTRAALEAAQARAERARIETIQAEAERDRLAAERDMALAAQAMGEQPEMDPATLEKQMTAAAKRLATERTERDAAEGALRGLQARLSREIAERPAILAAIRVGQQEARVALQEAGDAVFGRIAAIIIDELAPLSLAEGTVNGSYLTTQIHQHLHLDEPGPGKPMRTVSVRNAARSAPVPPAFLHAGMVTERLARAVEHEA